MNDTTHADLTRESSRFDAFRIQEAPEGDARAAAMAWAFPTVESYLQPMGSQIVVQLRCPSKTVGKGLLLATDETRDGKQYDEQIGKVLLLGPGCYINRTTGEPWPEAEKTGGRVNVGDIIRLPRSGLDRWLQPVAGREQPVMLVLIRDTDVRALWIADPLHVDSARSGW